LRGEQGTLSTWQTALLPHTLQSMTVALPAELTGLPDNLNKPLPVDGTAGAWVCEGRRCLPEFQQLEVLLATITSSENRESIRF